MIKLVATDIDGTLLPEGTHSLDPAYYEMVRELKKRGILFAVASGRQYASMYRVFEPVAQDVIFIAENGSNVMWQGKNMSSHYIEPSLAEEVVRYTRTLEGCATALSTPETIYAEKGDPWLYDLLNDVYKMNTGCADDLVELCSHTNKLCVCRREGIAPVAEQYMERFGTILNTMVSGKVWIDFMSLSSDKGHALAEIQKLMHISPEETMAFGDNCNDIGMLKQAGESYAVANANPQLFEVAKHIAPANTENGVLRVIRETLFAD